MYKKSSDDLYKTRNNYKKIYIYGFTKNIKKQSSCVHVTTEKNIFRSTLSCARYVMILDGLTTIIKWNVSMEL